MSTGSKLPLRFATRIVVCVVSSNWGAAADEFVAVKVSIGYRLSVLVLLNFRDRTTKHP
jgi:hypothetical protein